MRHGKKFNHLGRTAAHRSAMLSNMANSLILHKRISTTVAKAKALRKYVEPLITKAKDDTTHSRRNVFSKLQDKESVTILFNQVAQKVSERPGGYTRIIKTGNRLGDNADMCIIELVDYNELLIKESKPAKSKSRRSRRGSSKSSEGETAVEATKEEKKVEAKAEEVKAEKVEAKTEPKVEEKAAEEPKAEAKEAAEKQEKEEKAPEAKKESESGSDEDGKKE